MTLLQNVLAAGVLTAALSAGSGGVHAQAFVTGAQLARTCASHTPTDENACNGYIAGALDEVAANAELRAAVCPPVEEAVRPQPHHFSALAQLSLSQ